MYTPPVRRPSGIISDVRVLVLGSTGRIGGPATTTAIERRHDVVALVRDRTALVARSGLTLVTGDVRDPAAIDAAVGGVDAVIAAVGPRSNTLEGELALETGMRNLVAAMVRHGVVRLVALSGAGVDVPGDRKPLVDRFMSTIVRRLARHVVGAKQREYEVLAASTLAWTALRPPLVSDGPERGYRLDLRLEPGARVTRADIGRALVDQLIDDGFVRAAPFVLPARRR